MCLVPPVPLGACGAAIVVTPASVSPGRADDLLAIQLVARSASGKWLGLAFRQRMVGRLLVVHYGFQSRRTRGTGHSSADSREVM